MDATLLPLLRDDAVPIEVVRRRYGGLVDLVSTLIGVVPNSMSYLEIWPVAFRTFNVMVPNLLNLPIMLWGLGAPRHIIGLAMYAASRAAGCGYCSAHCCSFALRRGASSDSFVGVPGSAAQSEVGAAMAVGRALSRVPAALTDEERANLALRFSPSDVEWIVLAVAMMGFLNKFMDAVGVELEPQIAGEAQTIIAPTGWRPGKHFAGPAPALAPPPADTIGTRLRALRNAPAAIRFDRRWTAGAPSQWPAAGEWLRVATGHDFPVLSRLTHRRAIRAIAAIVRDNLDAATSVIGLPLKVRLGGVYAGVAGDATLAGEIDMLATRQAPSADDARARAAIQLARAASSSPAQIDAEVVEACRASGLVAAAIVEIVVWLGVLQMLHRLSAFYRASL
jgi:alkylhydroperoxidase family enzyme